MKKVASILLMVFSSFLLMVFIVMALTLLLSDFHLGSFIIALIIFLFPGVILLVVSIKMFSGGSKSNSDPRLAGMHGQSATTGGGSFKQPKPAPSSATDDVHTINLFDPNPNANSRRRFNVSNGSVHTTQTTFSTTTTTTSSSNFDPKAINVTFTNIFGGDNEAKPEEPKGPVTVECSGCGSKTLVQPNQSAKCEFCGTMVTYRQP